MATVLEQLELIRTNVTENWDGYGGLAPVPAAVDAAMAFYRSVSAAPELAAPYVGPTPNGGVQFDWDNGPHHLEVAFEPATVNGPISVEFLYDNTQTGVVVEGQIRHLPGAEALPYPLRQIVSGFATVAA